jgi:hypothetical protein
MSKAGLRLRHLGFHGPKRPPAEVAFGPGLNVIYGASETGKSFIVETIDFMLGGRTPLRDIPERVGYDRVLLALETITGEGFTLLRSVDGGGFRAYTGVHLEPPTEEAQFTELADQHSEKSPHNLSRFLLERCALDGKRIRRNKAGETNSLSFRYLARLLIVTETRITEQRSPLVDDNPTADTPNFATFKLLLTGVDDSALVGSKSKTVEDQSREAQVDLLSQMLSEHRKRLGELTKDPDDLDDHLQKIESALSEHGEHLAATEGDYRSLVDRRRELRARLEEGRDRRSEIGSLLERFSLLERHYVSDLARLRGIEEAGTLFEVLAQAPCPLCGAQPAHHRLDSECDGNITVVVLAARAEIDKIALLRTELSQTIKALMREDTTFAKRLPKVEEQLKTVSAEVDRLIAPKLATLRATYAELADKRGRVREAMALLRTIENIESRRTNIGNSSEDRKESSISDGDLSTTIGEAFAQQVEVILKEWHFAEAERVYFDAKSRDLVIAGKARTARGKGLRAITHAAFTIALLEYCRAKETPHPGFVILDSPLLAYRAPEGPEDDLAGTDLDERFYSYLANLPTDVQVIIVENIDPPVTMRQRSQVTMFSKNPKGGRYGFFPIAWPPALASENER